MLLTCPTRTVGPVLVTGAVLLAFLWVAATGQAIGPSATSRPPIRPPSPSKGQPISEFVAATQPGAPEAPTTRPAAVATTPPAAVNAAPPAEPVLTTRPAAAATTPPAAANAAPPAGPAPTAVPPTPLAAVESGQAVTTQAANVGEPGQAGSAASQPAEPTTRQAQKANIVFQFDGITVLDVVKRFAQMVQKPLLGDLTGAELQKEVTFFDSEPYTYEDALDTLNLILEMRNYRLMEEGRFLRLRELGAFRGGTNVIKGLAQIDDPDTRQSDIVTVVIPLKQLDPQEAVKAVTPMVSATYGSLVPLARGKGIIITESVQNIQRIRQLLSQMEAEPAIAEEQLRSVKLKNASATNVAQIIARLFSGAASPVPGQPRNRPGPPEQPQPPQPQPQQPDAARLAAGRLIATADERTNIVLLLGPPDKLDLAEQLIEKLDAPEGMEGGEVRVFKLQQANAAEVEATLQRMFGGGVPGRARDTIEFRVAADPTSNRLIISGPVEDMKQAEDLIKELDQAVDTETGAKVFPLKFADAVSLAPVIINASSKPDAARRGRPTTNLSVTADPQTNSLIVVGPVADMRAAEALIAQLDQQDTQQTREVHVVQLTAGSDARQIARQLLTVFIRPPSRRGAPDAQSLRIEGDPTTNTLMVAASLSDWEAIKKSLDELQAAATPQTSPITRIIPLQNADPDEMAGTLNRIYAARKREDRTAVPVTIASSKAGNSLIVSASELELKEIGELVASLDLPATQAAEPVVMIRLESADAVAVAAKLQSLIPRGGGRAPAGQDVLIQADEATNTILIRGPEAQRKVLEDAIAQLDQATQSQAREVMTIKLKAASAKAVSAMLAQLYRSKEGPAGARGRAPGSAADDSVVVAPSPDDHMVVIEAPRDKSKEIQALVASLDAQSTQPETQLRTYQGGRSDATRLARTLANLMSQRKGPGQPSDQPDPRFDADAGTNQLIVSATQEQFAEIEKLIQQVQGAPALASQMRTFPLTHAKADELVTLLESMLGEDRGGRGGAPETTPTRIAAVAASNAIVVQASPEKLALAEQLISQFDTPEATAQSAVIKVVRLANAKADTLAQAVSRSLAETPSTPGRAKPQGQPVSITAEPNSNALLVRGSADEVAGVITMIKGLDAESTSDEVQMRVYSLKNSDAADLAKSLGTMFNDMMRQRSRGGNVVFSVAADERTNRLIVTTSNAQFALVEEILSNLDKESDKPVNDVRYFWLENAYASSIATRVEAMFSSRPKADRPLVESDFFDNTLTVIAKPADMKEIEGVITKLDKEAVDTSVTIKVMPITGAKADMMAETIRRVYGQMTTSPIVVTEKLPGQAATQPARLPMPSVDADSRQPVRATTRPASQPAASVGGAGAGQTAAGPAAATGASDENMFNQPELPPVTIAVDKQSNSLIISATQKEYDKIRDLVYDLTRSGVGGAEEIQVVQVEHANVESVAAILNDLFNPKPVAQPAPPQQPQRGRQQGQEEGQPQQQQQQQQQPMPPQIKQNVVVIADARTRRLIIRAKPADFELMKSLIETLDQTPTVVNVLRIFPLKNTNATEVARNLQEIFNLSTPQAGPAGAAAAAAAAARGRNTPQQLRAEAVQRMIELTSEQGTTKVDASSAISISANTQSNSVVVVAPTESMELVTKIIEELDQSAVDTFVPIVKLYPIKNAEVGEIVTSLQETFTQQARQGPGPRQQVLTAEAPVVVTGNESAGLVIVSATAEKHKLIAQMISDLDKAVGGDTPTVKVYKIQYADAQSMAGALSGAIGPSAAAAPGGRATRGGSAGNLRISPDRASNSIIVRATASDHEKIAGLIAQMDVPVSPGGEARLIPVEYADPANLAQVLTRTFVGAAQTGGGGRGGPTAGQVSIEADVQSRMLLVRCDDETFTRIQKMVADLDKASGAQEKEGTKIVQLTNGDAASVAATIQDLYRQQQAAASRDKRTIEPLAVSADTRANAIILSGSKKMLDQVSDWINQVEQMTPPVGTMRLIELKNADPGEVQRAIVELFQGGSPAARPRPAPAPGAPAAPGAAPAPAPGAPAAPGAAPAPAPGAPAVPGAAPVPAPGAPVARPAPATPAAPAVAPPRPAAPAAAAKGASVSKSGRVETSVLPNQRALLISASDADFEAIKALAEQLDKAAETAKKKVKVFVLEHASNTQMANALMTIYRAPARPEDAVSVAALPQTNAVVVTAVQEKIDEVGGLIAQLDNPQVSPELDFKVYPLANAKPAKILPALRNMLAMITKVRPDDPINIEADDRTRSIIVSARGEQVFAQIEKMIKSLDAEDVWGTQVQVLIIPLKKADASNLAAVLNEMLRPSAEGVITPEAKALQEQIRLLKVRSTMHEDIPELDLNKPIKIQADTAQAQGSNSLMITSTPDNLKAMQAIVEVMDTVPISEGVKVRLLHLTNADAQSVMTILREMFTQGKQLAGKSGTSVSGKAEPQSVSGKALVNQLNVSADIRTNTLVLSGLEESLALAEVIVKDLDREHGQLVTEVRVFGLKYASAAKLMPMLQAVFAEGSPVPEAEGLRAFVTRLRTVMDEQHTATSTLAKSRAALTIQADATTNMLVVAARSDVMPLIADVIATMDIPGAGSGNSVRVFPLKNAEAARVQKILQDLNSGVNQALIEDRDKPTVAVDTRTNSIIVWTSQRTFELIDSLLKSIDADQSVDLASVQVVPLANAEAKALATTLQAMMDARVKRQAALDQLAADALRVVILADDRSNSLIVGGSRENYLFVKALAEQLDGANPALGGQVQLLGLAKANAGTLAQSLTNLFDQRYQAARTPDVQKQKPIILPDLRTNSLMVVANQDDSNILKSLLTKLDVEITDPAVRIEVMPILHNDAGVVGPMIQNLFQARLQSMTAAGQTAAPQDRVDVAFDILSNALVISASKENLSLITGLLEKVDVEPADRTGLVKMYPLKNSDAQRISTMLGGLFTTGLYKPGLTISGNNQLLQAREKVAIAFDIRTNVLIVSASKENFAVIDELINTLDASDDYGLLGDVRMYQLKHANSDDVGPTLQRFFDQKRTAEQQTGASGRSLPVVIISDPRTNTLLVAGSKESFNAVDAMIAKLDATDVPPATDFRTFYLKHATAAAVQPMLDKLFSQRIARGTTKNTVTVIADAKTNSLMVGAAPDDMKTVESLIEQVDVDPGKAGNAAKVFSLLKADAKQVITAINGLYQGQGGTAQAGITLSADERTNAVIVQGGPVDLERISDLIQQLDSDAIAEVCEIRIFQLEYADATELAQVLNDTLTKKPQSLTGGSQNRSNLLQYIAQHGGKELINTALQEGVLITPEARTNSLVVYAPVQFMPLLGDLVKGLDLISPRTAEIRVMPLVNADATRMGDVLSKLFKLEQASSTSSMVKYTTPSGASAVIGSNEQSALSITVDVRTNSLLVGGTKQYVELVENIVQQLDASPAQERINKVYRLRNARAADIETAVTSFLDKEYQHLVDRLGEEGVGAAQKMLDREVSVVSVAADGEAANANTLLISASPRYFDTVMGIIKELDQPAPQVLIQVLLVEVSIDDTTDFGMDWSLDMSHGAKSRSVGTDFGVEGDIASLGGFSVAVSGGDFSYFLKALESTSRVEVLSRPQLLASDNKTSTINVGQRVPFITNTRVTETGGVFNTISYENVGIILEVTPRINPDGFVKLEVKPEISSVAESTIQVSEGVTAIVVNTRQADTTVTVQDGHTIVIGGLITTEKNKTEHKVPLLGDIPGLGWLFKETKDIKKRGELLIVLTPYVMNNVEEADQVTSEQIEGLKLKKAGDTSDDPVVKPGVDWLKSLRKPGAEEDFQEQDEGTPPDAEPAPRMGGGAKPVQPEDQDAPVLMEKLSDVRAARASDVAIDPDSLPDMDRARN